MMSKGKATRDQILRQATDLASVGGLEGLTIGALASHSGMSKSGLFAHFGSKEALQLAVLEAVRTEFVFEVVAPARKFTGRKRLEALSENWLAWASTNGYVGGCPFVAAAVEWDDREGPVRDAVQDALALWQSYLSRAAQQAIDAGEFRTDLDPAQFAFDAYAIELGFHNGHRLMGQTDAAKWTRAAFVRLITDALAPH
jgi:AcrR family transcriptional regulator